MANLIPKGYYNAMAAPVETDEGRLWAQFGEAKSGTKQVLVHFEILDGTYAGSKLPWFGYFTKDTIARTLESLRIAGFKGDDLETFPWQQPDQKVSITVEHNTYEGKTHARVAWVNKPGGGGVKLANPLGKDGLRQFAAQMKSYVKQAPEVAGEKGERQPPSAAPADSPPPDDFNQGRPVDDDIPF